MCQLSSGGLYIHSQKDGGTTYIGPNEASIGEKNILVTSSDTTVMGDWIKEYWRGPKSYWNL